MGGGGAAIAAMVQAMRNNRIVLKSKRNVFDKHPSKGKMLHHELKFKETTPGEMQVFREKIQTEKRKQAWLTAVICFIGAILGALLIYLIST